MSTSAAAKVIADALALSDEERAAVAEERFTMKVNSIRSPWPHSSPSCVRCTSPRISGPRLPLAAARPESRETLAKRAERSLRELRGRDAPARYLLSRPTSA